ncbi:protein S100-G [Passer domesticus]|uniref:protein S100-G n=1 Tax=Passer domesticus TaxID=48849 RepID=UPI0030FE07E5
MTHASFIIRVEHASNYKGCPNLRLSLLDTSESSGFRESCSSRQHLRNMEHLFNENLLKYFTQYALQEGSTNALSIGGLKNLLQNQFAQYLKDQFSLDNIIKSLDKNQDGSVSFDEFIMIVKKITGTGQ